MSGKIRFDFEEAELFNSFYEDNDISNISRETFISKLEISLSNTNDPLIADCFTSLIGKLKGVSDNYFSLLLASYPVNSFYYY